MTTDIKQMMVDAKFKEFGTLKHQLETKKSKANESVTLLKHMTKVMDHIVEHCPQQALDKFEEISYLIKHQDSL